MDPMTLIMLAMIGLLIIFMVRNGKKRRDQIATMQAGIQVGAEIMLQSGIYGVVEEIDEEEQRIVLRSGTGQLVVHRSSVMNIVTPVEDDSVVAPDDDPNFGQAQNGEDASASQESTDDPESDATDSDRR